MKSRYRLQLVRALSAVLLATALCAEVNAQDLDQRIQRIVNRPEYRHASWGIAFYSLDRSKALYSLNSEKLFSAGSTAKLITMGAALDLLGGDFRFRTPVYYDGAITDGTLKGNLIMVASGDPNLSGRPQDGDTLGFTNWDHVFAGSPGSGIVPGDAAMPFRKLAAQIAKAGIKRIEGQAREAVLAISCLAQKIRRAENIHSIV